MDKQTFGQFQTLFIFLNGLHNIGIMFSEPSKEFFGKPSGPGDFLKAIVQYLLKVTGFFSICIIYLINFNNFQKNHSFINIFT